MECDYLFRTQLDTLLACVRYSTIHWMARLWLDVSMSVWLVRKSNQHARLDRMLLFVCITITTQQPASQPASQVRKYAMPQCTGGMPPKYSRHGDDDGCQNIGPVVPVVEEFPRVCVYVSCFEITNTQHSTQSGPKSYALYVRSKFTHIAHRHARESRSHEDVCAHNVMIDIFNKLVNTQTHSLICKQMPDSCDERMRACPVVFWMCINKYLNSGVKGQTQRERCAACIHKYYPCPVYYCLIN